MEPKRVCLVTVHGIGFQRPPCRHPPTPGYADQLHKHLKAVLDGALGEDVEGRKCGPVYVQSEFERSRKKGLGRLKKKQLVQGGSIAHVALVYSRSEDVGPQLGATLQTLVRAAFTFWRYTGPLGVIRIAWRALSGYLRQHSANPEAISTLTPRLDVGRDGRRERLRRYAKGDKPPAKMTVIRALEDDVAAYVYRNDLRERVRGFVQQALQLLLERGDVGVIVINAHSQGTVLCWDVLCRLPLTDDDVGWAKRIPAFVTAGSPIRKYVDVFSWGERVGQMVALTPDDFTWRNYFDPCDPVADPLDPTPLVAVDLASGIECHFPIADHRISNVQHSSGGGLQAHDYWNNETEFVAPLAALLKQLAAAPPTP